MENTCAMAVSMVERVVGEVGIKFDQLKEWATPTVVVELWPAL